MSVNGERPMLRNLQGLLQETIGQDVEVVDYKTSLFQQKGESYLSTMVKVDAVVKKTKDSPEEDMHFVAKMQPKSEFHKKLLNSEASFNKEIFVIGTLGKWYRQLERQAGVKEEDLIDVHPKFYGGRLNNKENPDDTVDEDAVMLMENLNVRGYETMDRFNGMDFEHMKLAVKEYAHFHALGVALRLKKPDLWEATRKPINTVALNLVDNGFDALAKQALECVRSDPRANNYKDQIEESLANCDGFSEALLRVEEEEPWVSIVHGDSWVNNMLFHHTQNGVADSIMFIDYQETRMNSPLKDIQYFLCVSGNIDVIENRFDELLDIYYNRFIEVLAKLSCDTSPFTKESYEAKLKEDSRNELIHCVVALKFITNPISQDTNGSDMRSSVFQKNPNQLFLDRSFKIISKFIEKGWI